MDLIFAVIVYQTAQVDGLYFLTFTGGCLRSVLDGGRY